MLQTLPTEYIYLRGVDKSLARPGRKQATATEDFHFHIIIIIIIIIIMRGFGGLVPKFAGSNPAEAVGFLRAKKSSARLPSEGK